MITVANSQRFNDRADGLVGYAPDMDSATIEMPRGGLSSLLEGFNHQAEPVQRGSFMAGIEAGLAGYADSLKSNTPDFTNYWGVPAAQTSAPSDGLVTGIGSLADSLTGSAPVEQSVNTSRLSQSFGGLSAPQQPEIGEQQPSVSAFHRRYSGPENN